MKIGLFQSDIISGNKAANYRKYSSALREAAGREIDILFLPELSVTGFSAEAGKYAEAVNGETVSFFRSECAAARTACGFGFAEKYGEKALNKYIVCGKDGSILSEYAKIHPFSFGGENKSFVGGESVSVFDMNGFSFSTFVCYDLRFPEIFQAVSDRCGIIVVAADWAVSRLSQWRALLCARAIENQCYVCGVNRAASEEKQGGSVVFSPEGICVAEAGGTEELLVFEPDKNAVAALRSSFQMKNDRRPEIYKGFY